MGNPPVKLSPHTQNCEHFKVFIPSLLFRKKLAIDIIMEVMLKIDH